jgi:hypothetical protein
MGLFGCLLGPKVLPRAPRSQAAPPGGNRFTWPRVGYRVEFCA